MIHAKNTVLLCCLLLFSSFANADVNWPIKLRPGNTLLVSAVNATAYKFSGYCASGHGDVNITFGALSFTAPCHNVLGAYQHIGDVSSETTTNPIRHCATQGTSPVLCARVVTNEQAPPGMSFKFDPLKKIAPNNETDYRLAGSCAPVGAAISIDIGAQINVISGTCAANNSFTLAGDASAVLDGLGIPVAGNITSGTTSTVFSTVVKGVRVEILSAPDITASNFTSYDISGSCSDEGRDILLNIGGYIPSPLPTCSSSAWSLTGLDLSSVSEGAVVITADHNDELGNSAVQAVENVTKDSLVPDLLSWLWTLAPLTGTSSQDISPMVDASSAEDAVSVQIYDDALCLSAVGSTQVVSAGALSVSDITYTPISEEGQKDFYSIGVDPIGNTSGCVNLSLEYFLDTVDPNPITSFAFDAVWINTDSGAPQAQWDAATDPAPSSGLTDLEIGFTTNILGGSEVSSGFISLTPLDTAYTYSPGTGVVSECVDHYATLKARDDAGNEVEATTAVPFKYDGTAPAFVGEPYVYEFAESTKATGVDWSRISLADTCSGLNEIQIAIGTSLGAEDVVSYSALPVDVSVDTRYRVEDAVDGFSLSLQENELYYTSLKFIDVAGNESTVSVGPWRIPFFKLGTSAEATCGIDKANSIKCLGRSNQGSMGYGNNTRTSLAPAMVDGLDSGWVQVGTGVRFGCGLSNTGGVKCWGDGNYGQLGDGAITDNYTPDDVVGLSSGVKNIGIGYRHACAVLDTGGIKCWGQNNYRQLGNGITGNLSSPVDVVGITNAVQVSSGQYYTCALLDTAEVKCWGRGTYGRLGNGSTATQSAPILVTGIDTATYITTGLYHGCANLLGGETKCWGRGLYGRLGDGGTADQLSPVLVSGLTDAIEVEAYNSHTCAVNFSGGVQCWGYGLYGRIGDGFTLDRLTPVDVSGLTTGVQTISTGDWALHTCSLTDENTLKCWGRNNYYQTGANTSTAEVHVAKEMGAFKRKILKIDGGQNFTCALEDDGSGVSGGLRCWGVGSYGRLGTGVTTTSYPLFYVPGLESGVKDFSVGYFHACALVDDGAGAGGVKCWGRNNQGQIGNNTLVDQYSPVDVIGLTSGVVSLETHLYHGCAITTSGALYCWGDNGQGQLGNGTRTDSPTPILVSGVSNVQQVATGRYHTCVVTTAGALNCWGDNVRGQIGDGTTTDRLSPVLIMASGAESVSAGYRHTCSVSTLGALSCWGENIYGEVGDGTLTRRTSPAAVSGMSSGVNSVSAGFRYTCSSMDDGGMYCWGDSGTYGRLGDGTAVDSSVPIEIINYTGDVDQISTSLLTNGQTCMLQTDGEAYCWGYYGGYNHGWGSYWTTDPTSYMSPFKAVSSFVSE